MFSFQEDEVKSGKGHQHLYVEWHNSFTDNFRLRFCKQILLTPEIQCYWLESRNEVISPADQQRTLIKNCKYFHRSRESKTKSNGKYRPRLSAVIAHPHLSTCNITVIRISNTAKKWRDEWLCAGLGRSGTPVSVTVLHTCAITLSKSLHLSKAQFAFSLLRDYCVQDIWHPQWLVPHWCHEGMMPYLLQLQQVSRRSRGGLSAKPHTV